MDFLRRDDIDRHVDAYFKYVYPNQANAFLRRSDIVKRLANSAHHSILIKAICVVAARFLAPACSHREGGEHVVQWSREVRQELMGNSNSFNVETVAAMLLINQHEWYSGNYGSNWLLVSMASRVAFGMRLNFGHGDQTWIEAETQRRLMWAVFHADTYAGAGIREYITCPLHAIHLALPSNDQNFQLGIPIDTPVFDLDKSTDTPVSDITARFVWVMAIRARVLYCIKNLDRDRKPWDPGSSHAACQRYLDHWQETLPPELALTVDNLYARSAANQLSALIVLHLWIVASRCDLYRISMPGFDESAPPAYFADAPDAWISEARAKCYRHAQQISQIMTFVQDIFPDFVPLDALFPIFAYESCRNQLQYALITGIPLDTLERVTVFEVMVQTVRRMIVFFPNVKTLAREIHRLLLRHGVMLPSALEDLDASGLETPHTVWNGPVLSKLHMLRQHKASHSEGTQLSGGVEARGLTSLENADTFLSRQVQPSQVETAPEPAIQPNASDSELRANDSELTQGPTLFDSTSFGFDFHGLSGIDELWTAVESDWFVSDFEQP